MFAVLQEKGYQAAIQLKEGKPSQIRSSINGHKYNIYFFGVGETGRAKVIEFGYGVVLKEKIAAERISQWNRKFRFGRAYLDDDEDDPILEMDLNVERGCTSAMLDNTVDRWISVLDRFVNHINDSAAEPQ